jgi:hypothetical protein
LRAFDPGLISWLRVPWLCNSAKRGKQPRQLSIPTIFLAKKALCDFLSKRALSRADQCLDAGRYWFYRHGKIE